MKFLLIIATFMLSLSLPSVASAGKGSPPDMMMDSLIRTCLGGGRIEDLACQSRLTIVDNKWLLFGESPNWVSCSDVSVLPYSSDSDNSKLPPECFTRISGARFSIERMKQATKNMRSGKYVLTPARDFYSLQERLEFYRSEWNRKFPNRTRQN